MGREGGKEGGPLLAHSSVQSHEVHLTATSGSNASKEDLKHTHKGKGGGEGGGRKCKNGSQLPAPHKK